MRGQAKAKKWEKLAWIRANRKAWEGLPIDGRDLTPEDEARVKDIYQRMTRMGLVAVTSCWNARNIVLALVGEVRKERWGT